MGLLLRKRAEQRAGPVECPGPTWKGFKYCYYIFTYQRQREGGARMERIVITEQLQCVSY